MSIPGESFPFRPMNEAERGIVVAHCGGYAMDNKDYVVEFLERSGKLLCKTEIPRICNLVYNSRRIVKAVLSPSPTIRQSYDWGSYLYAGILSDVVGVERVSADPELVMEIDQMTDDRPLDLALDAYNAGVAIPDFGTILDEIGPVLYGRSEDDRKAMIMGAGMVHRIATSTDALLHPSIAESDIPDFNLLFEYIESNPSQDML